MQLLQRTATRNLLSLLSLCAMAAVNAAAAPTSAYPQASPTNDEQYMLELINAARANPPAEGQELAAINDPMILQDYSYYKVSTSLLISQFATYQAMPPLAFNSDLMASSQSQSVDQATHGFQGHNGSDGSTFDGRITAEGYNWSFCGENVYAYAQDAYFCHVAFQADWGVPTLDHRANIMNDNPAYPIFREIGISCVASSVKGYGPMVVTQDFATPMDPTKAYLVGVVYNDANGNGRYDQGEGYGGVTISPDGCNYYAITSASGGFAIPLPASGSGTLTVVASGGALGAPRVKTVQYTAGTNVMLDFTPADAVGSLLPVVMMSASSKDAIPASGQTGNITISRSGSTDQPLTVNLTFGGTAVNGVDCNMIPSTMTIPAGSASVNLTVQATNPSLTSVAKFKICLAPSASYSLSANVQQAKARVRIHGANS